MKKQLNANNVLIYIILLSLLLCLVVISLILGAIANVRQEIITHLRQHELTLSPFNGALLSAMRMSGALCPLSAEEHSAFCAPPRSDKRTACLSTTGDYIRSLVYYRMIDLLVSNYILVRNSLPKWEFSEVLI